LPVLANAVVIAIRAAAQTSAANAAIFPDVRVAL
jgi:hypothetical protein